MAVNDSAAREVEKRAIERRDSVKDLNPQGERSDGAVTGSGTLLY
jgi:hypothetical protein